MIEDITRRKEAEAALRDREEMLALGAADMAMWSWEIGSKVVFPDPEVCRAKTRASRLRPGVAST